MSQLRTNSGLFGAVNLSSCLATDELTNNTSPLTIITSVPILCWVRADLGITIATGVSAWLDQSPANNHFAQALSGSQPTYNAADATIDNQASLTCDGIDDSLVNATLNLGNPTVTPFYYWFIVKRVTGTSGTTIIGANGQSAAVANTTAPNIRQHNVSSANIIAGPAVGTWGRVAASFTGSTADFLQVGATTVTGGNAGATDPTGGFFGLGARSQGNLNFSNTAFAELLITQGVPTELAALNAYGAARYPSVTF